MNPFRHLPHGRPAKSGLRPGGIMKKLAFALLDALGFVLFVGFTLLFAFGLWVWL